MEAERDRPTLTVRTEDGVRVVSRIWAGRGLVSINKGKMINRPQSTSTCCQRRSLPKQASPSSLFVLNFVLNFVLPPTSRPETSKPCHLVTFIFQLSLFTTSHHVTVNCQLSSRQLSLLPPSRRLPPSLLPIGSLSSGCCHDATGPCHVSTSMVSAGERRHVSIAGHGCD